MLAHASHCSPSHAMNTHPGWPDDGPSSHRPDSGIMSPKRPAEMHVSGLKLTRCQSDVLMCCYIKVAFIQY